MTSKQQHKINISIQYYWNHIVEKTSASLHNQNELYIVKKRKKQRRKKTFV